MDISLIVDSLSPRRSGIGRYCWELCQRLPSLDGIDSVCYYKGGQFFPDPSVLIAEDSLRVPRSAGRLIPRRFHRVLARRRLNRGLVHAPNYFLPDEAEGGVVTVHDLSVIKHPETHPKKRIDQFARDFEKSARRASKIITDTETVRQEVIEYFGLVPESVRAIPLGVDPIFHPRNCAEVDDVLNTYGLTYSGYCLSVSTLEPRKRVNVLLRAWARLPSSLQRAFPLVLAGQLGWLNDDLGPLIEGGIAAGWLRYVGFVDEKDLPILYSGAAAFAYPSIYEGFGLPLLEAMASGVPVLASGRSCMPEVCGEAAFYIDPDDEDALPQSIESFLTDENWRAKAREWGLIRAACFSWDACVSATVALYRDVSA